MKQPVLSTAWRNLLTVLIVGYTLLLLYWMFLGFGRRPGSSFHYNVIPLRTIRLYIQYGWTMSPKIWIINLFGNMAVFVPFGLLLPLLIKKLQSWLGLTVVLVSSILVVEWMQMLLRVGSFDVDDVILNTVGVWIGWVISSIWRERFGIKRGTKV
ncbi:glycopeptide antibiotics resistance protein [Paenibacillus rhizosphaerae]|uniref:Glycopeptide antibiotics resistance protein n=1 Tax=Paenibacillus rhizosphaerae TaxID=297318 RepID=A0A839TK95_9BACL|nr:VanZ family protein [Paenibacillus rhizosphaerae]MBB3125789.1 glycopeptide antibiotics resistance protein [Paenibacillus rhizosphaerae]